VQAGREPHDQWVFVDECGTHIALTPLYARSPRGTRAVGKVPRNTGANTTLGVFALSRSSLRRGQNVDDVSSSGLFSSSLTLYLDKVQKVSNDAGGAKGSTAKTLFFCFINGVLFSHHGDALVSRD